jgi:hypothetical protein
VFKTNKYLIIIGVVLIAIGLFAGAFTTTESQLFGLIDVSSIPYEAYAIPLFVGGIVLIIVGGVLGAKKK